jgi:hypothetical protein
VGVAEQLGVGDPAQPSVEPMMCYPGLADAAKTAFADLAASFPDEPI